MVKKRGKKCAKKQKKLKKFFKKNLIFFFKNQNLPNRYEKGLKRKKIP